MDNDDNRQVVILGAGMAGLGAGIQAQKMGLSSLILEKEDYVGGLFSNHSIMGCDFDYGPKILVETPNSKEIVEYMGANCERYDHDERVYLSEHGLLGFPLQRNLYQLPELEREKILSSFLSSNDGEAEGTVNNFEEWLRFNYGDYFSESFLIPYEKKKWLVDLTEMDYQWAEKRHLKVDREELIAGSQGELPGYRWYFYPKTGNVTEVVKALLPHAGPIQTERPVSNIDLDKKLVTAGGIEYPYDILINTMPMDYLSTIAAPFPEELKLKGDQGLKRLSILIFNLVFEGNYDLDGTAIYFSEEEFIFRRVTVLENLCPALSRKGLTPITVEVSVKDIDQIDKEKVLNKVLIDLKKMKQFSVMGDPVATGTLDVNFAYPLQTRELSTIVDDMQSHLKKYDVFNAGRGGTFNYCDGDLAYSQGKAAVTEAFASAEA